MEYKQIAVYLRKKYIGRFDESKVQHVISNRLHNNWEYGDGKLEPYDFSLQLRTGKVFDFRN